MQTEPDPPKLHYNIERFLPSICYIGEGLTQIISGWVFHIDREIAEMWISVGNQKLAINQTREIRDDIVAQFMGKDPLGHTATAGFWVAMPLLREWVGQHYEVKIHIKLEDGRQFELISARISFKNFKPSPLVYFPEKPSSDPLVAICMATYNPDLNAIRKQLDSIKQQTYQNWFCIIHDDGSADDWITVIEAEYNDDLRFIFIRNMINKGFYRNFEEALKRVPTAAKFVTFSDQDDYWYPDKLQQLMDHFEEDTQLVYSDMQICDESGKVLSKSFWGARKNQYKNLEVLALANTVTGAASMFRASLLKKALPFPDEVEHMCHDQWVACCAAAEGKIRYIDTPLYDYIQHHNNAIGYSKLSVGKLNERFWLMIKLWLTSLWLWCGLPLFNWLPVRRAYNTFLTEHLRLTLIYNTLKLRFPGVGLSHLRRLSQLPIKKHSILTAIIQGVGSFRTTYWLELRMAVYYSARRLLQKELPKVRKYVIQHVYVNHNHQ